MEWMVVIAALSGLAIGAIVGWLARRVAVNAGRPTITRHRVSSATAGEPAALGGSGGSPPRSGDTGPQPATAGSSATLSGLSATPSGPLAEISRRSVNALRVGVVVLDPDDVPVLINPAARALGLLRTGATPGSVVAHPIVRSLAARVRRSGVRREIELDLPRERDGGPVAGEGSPVGVLLRAMALGGGFISVEAADVTESHRVARVRRDFVANVSHELKTPIGALQLLAEALLDATAPAGALSVDPVWDVAAARRFAERIKYESTRLGRLVNELLELTRLQGAEPLPEPEPVAVDWVVAEVIDRTRIAAAARQVEIVVTGEPDLVVYGSDTQIATAVANLVDNAVAYSGERSEVTVRTTSHDDHVEIAVTDQGIGIAPDDLDRIFERFYRADQARSRTTGGTGLGLAIVKHIVTNHGGRVDVSSALGSGSTFTLRLPARPPEEEGRTPASAELDEAPVGSRQA